MKESPNTIRAFFVLCAILSIPMGLSVFSNGAAMAGLVQVGFGLLYLSFGIAFHWYLRQASWVMKGALGLGFASNVLVGGIIGAFVSGYLLYQVIRMEKELVLA